MKNIGKILLTSSAAIMMTNFSNANNIPYSKNYVAFGIGQTFATKASIPQPQGWWIPKEGYNSYFKNSQSITLDIGYILLNGKLLLGINYNYLPKLKYSKIQSNIDPNHQSPAPEILSRNFTLEHQMYGLTIGYMLQFNNIIYKPYVSVGYAINSALSPYTLNLTLPPTFITNKTKGVHHGLSERKTTPNFNIGLIFSHNKNPLFLELRFDYSKFEVYRILDQNEYSSGRTIGNIDELYTWKGKLKMFQVIIGTSVLFN